MKPRGDGGAADGTDARAAGELRGLSPFHGQTTAAFADAHPSPSGV